MHEFSNLVDLLRHRAQHHPKKMAFTFLRDGETEAEVLTYQELDRRARAIATRLQSMGATGQRALLLYSPNITFITAFLGCLYARVLAVPAYPPRPNQTMTRLRAMMTDAGATMALTTQQLLDNFGKLIDKNPDFAQLNWLTTDSLSENLAASWEMPAVSTDTLAFLQYTSGSTGLPKGVMVSHGNLLHNARAIHERFSDTAKTIGVSWLPPYHDMGLIGGILQPIYLNIPSVLMAPVSFLQRPLRWLQAISKYRGTTSGGPNFAYELCLRQITPEQRETLDLSSWSLAFSGAEPVRAETIQKFSEYFEPCGFRREAFYPCYGMAEATLFVTGGDRTQTPTCATIQGAALEQNTVIPSSETGDKMSGDRRQLIGCGIPSTAQNISIVNPSTLEPCPDLEVGEIWVSGPNIAQGYWNRPQQTQETFQARVAETGEGPFLRTGDLGFIKDGELFVTGRLKDLIVIRGLNHYPQDIEATVGQAHEQIRAGQGAAFSVDVDNEERLVVVYEMERTALRRLKTDDVVIAVRQSIAQHHTLQVYAIVLLKTGSIPKTSSGKIQRHACKKGFLDQSLTVVAQWRELDAYSESKLSSAETSPDSKIPEALSSTSTVPFFPSPLKIQNPKSKILRLPQSGAIASIQTWLVNQVARMLKVAPDVIDIHEPLARYGLDSIAAVRLSGALEDWLGRSLSPTLAYDYPSIAALSKYLSTDPQDLHDEMEQVAQGNYLKRRRTMDADIAIIGMGCRFPGANSPDEFWQLLQNGEDAIVSLEESDRWSGHSSAKVGGFLQQAVDEFDPQFFGISPREASRMDPQQRLLLEVCWETVEHAGIAPTRLAGTFTGVFVGISSNDYAQLQARETDTSPYTGTGTAHSIAANRLSYVLDLRGPSLTVDTACSSSLVALHTASQSLQQGDCDQAIAAGVNLILAPDLTLTFANAGMLASDGRCKTFDASADGYVRGEGCGVVLLKRLPDAERDGDTIFAVLKGSAINQDGRSNGLTAPNGLAQQAVIQSALQRAGVSPDAIDYVDAHGTGTVLGDPIELNALKAVLAKGRELNQTCWIGSAKTNIGHLEAAAGMAGVVKVILALNHQEIPPHLHVQSLNPHVVWDDGPLTVATSSQPWPIRPSQQRLAGVSSFGFGGTNAHVILGEYVGDAGGDRVPHKQSPQNQPLRDRPEPVGLRPLTQPTVTHHLFTLSAKTSQSLIDLIQRYLKVLEQNSEMDLASACATAYMGRSHFSHRLAIVTASIVDLKAQLEAQLIDQMSTRVSSLGATLSSPTRLESDSILPHPQKVAFLFTGQGSQYENMGYELYQHQPVFRRVINECDRILQTYLEYPLLHVLYPQERDKTAFAPLPKDLIHQTLYTQPALFAVEYALAELWQSWGIYPDVVMGHSVGEYVAACVAGVFSLEDGLKLIAGRSRLMQNLPDDGAMVAVFASKPVVLAAIQSSATKVSEALTSETSISDLLPVDIAAVNGPANIIISGERTAIAIVVDRLHAQNVTTKSLNVSHAFHSSLMVPILTNFEAIAHTIQYHSPQISLVSNVSGKIVSGKVSTECRERNDSEQRNRENNENNNNGDDDNLDVITPDYWVRHIRQSVQFADSMTTLFEAGYQTFLEVGPKPVLIGMGQRCLTNHASIESPSGLTSSSSSSISGRSDYQWLKSLRPNQSDWCALLTTAAHFYLDGMPLNWNGIAAGQAVQRLHHLPTYPWQRQRCWFTSNWDAVPTLAEVSTESKVTAVHDLQPLGNLSLSPPDWFYTVEWQPQSSTPVEHPSHNCHPGVTNSGDTNLGGWIIVVPPEQASASGEVSVKPINCFIASSIAEQLQAYGHNIWLMDLSVQMLKPLSFSEEGEPGTERESKDSLEADAILQQLGAIANGHTKPNDDNELPTVVDNGLVDALVDGLADKTAAAQRPNIEGIFVLAPGATALPTTDRSPCYFVMLFFQAFLRLSQGHEHWKQHPPKIWMLTQQGVVLDPVLNSIQSEIHQKMSFDSALGLEQSTLWGLGNVIALEHPEFWGGLIDVDLAETITTEVTTAINVVNKGDALESLSEEMKEDIKTVIGPVVDTICRSRNSSSGTNNGDRRYGSSGDRYDNGNEEKAIAFRNGQRYVQRLIPVSTCSARTLAPVHSTTHSPPRSHEHSTILITGGLGSLGLTLAQWFVEQHSVLHLTLMGRRAPSPAAAEAIAALEQQGATIYVAQGDVSQQVDLAFVLEQLEAEGLGLRGVIHAAGLLHDGLLQNQSWEQFTRVLQPKVEGAWHLHTLTQRLRQSSDLEFFVLFSSVASLLGSPGQGNYAAANAFMDTLAQYRRSQGLPALSINWGPWANGGMAIATGNALQQRLVRSGFDLIEPDQGLEWLSQLLFSPKAQTNTDSISTSIPAQIGAMTIRWDEIRKRLAPSQQAFLSPVLAQLDQSMGTENGRQETESRQQKSEDREQKAITNLSSWPENRQSPIEQLLATTESDRPSVFTTYLQHQISQVLQLRPEQLSTTSNLMDVGMDSLMVMEAINQLRQDFDIMLYPREFYEHPTLAALAEYLAQEFTRLHSEIQTTPSSTQAAASNNTPLLNIPNLHGTTTDITLHQGKRLPSAVFILSSPRSGSTLLRVMLAGHSRLFAAPELHLLPFNRMAERQQQLGESHLSEGLERSLMDLNQWDSDTSSAQVQDWLQQNVSIAEVYAALQASTGDRILVDKSPTYAMHRPTLDRAEALFKEAKYIHLVRHPYSVVESFVRMRMDKLLGIPAPHPHQLAEQIWCQSNQNILDFAATVDSDRYHLIRYEDLVRDPSATLNHLCQFLNIDLDPSLLNPYDGDRMTDGVHDTSLSLGDPNFLLHQRIDPNLADVWKTIMLPHSLEDTTEAIAHTFNYQFPDPSEQPENSGSTEYNIDNSISFRQNTPANSIIRGIQQTTESTPHLPHSELTLTLNDLTHTICTWGDDHAPPIVCIHGILDQGLIWEPIAQVLAQQGYRVIAPDLRGHGRSSHVGPGGSYHLLDFLTDINAIINALYPTLAPNSNPDSNSHSCLNSDPDQRPTPHQLFPSDPFQQNSQTTQRLESNIQQPKSLTLIGHSMGSIIAALYASSRPEQVRSLTMVETILPAEKRPQVINQLTALLDNQSPTPAHPIFPDVATAARRLRQGTPSLSEDFSLELAKRICVELDVATPATTNPDTTNPDTTNPDMGNLNIATGGVKWAWDEKLRNRTGIGFSRMPFGRGEYLQLLSQLTMPVTVVYGDRSTFNRPEDLAAQAQALSRANRIVLPGGHNLHLDAVPELAGAIMEAIANVLSQ